MSGVSVVIPSFNCGQYIVKSILSVLRQTVSADEIIVVDDGSTDDTYEVVKSYIDQGLIRYIYQDNRGVAEARNTGVSEATGDFIAYVDADDEIDKTMIRKCMERISQDSTGWCVTDILRVENFGNEIVTKIFKTTVPDQNLKNGILLNDFIRRMPLYKKKTLLEIGPYDKNLFTREDWDMNIRLILNGVRFSYIPEPLYIYKIRKNSLTKGTKNRSYDSTFKLLKKHHKKLADDGNKDVAKIYAHNLWRLGKAYLDLSDFRSCYSCLVESMKYDFNLKRLLHPFYFHLTKHFVQSNNRSQQ